MRKNITTNTPSEKRVGYSRMVVMNNKAYITGTTAVNSLGETQGNTLYTQTKYILQTIEDVLESEGFSLADVVSLTVYVTSMKHLADFDKAFIEYFYDIKPTCTLVGINELVKSDLLVEIAGIAEKE